MASDRETNENDQRATVQSVVLDVLRRRAAGESLPDDEVVASRPDLANLLRAELAKLQQICAAGNGEDDSLRVSASTADMRSIQTPGEFQVRCLTAVNSFMRRKIHQLPISCARYAAATLASPEQMSTHVRRQHCSR